MQKVLRATSYSTVSYSAWSRACDPCMFPPEKISPDSSLEGKYMLYGKFVFFICSLSLHSLFLHAFPSLLCSFYDNSFFSMRFNVWSPSPIYISVPLLISLLLTLPFFLILSFCCSSVLCVLWGRGPDSVHPVSPARSPCSWLPAPPKACHFQSMQYTLLPPCSSGSGTTPRPGHSCWANTER